jgi:hypothetical protein
VLGRTLWLVGFHGNGRITVPAHDMRDEGVLAPQSGLRLFAQLEEDARRGWLEDLTSPHRSPGGGGWEVADAPFPEFRALWVRLSGTH